MAMSDPVADMLTRIRNAGQVGQKRTDIPASKLKLEIARVLQKERFISNYKFVAGDGPQGIIRVYLKYTPGEEFVINGLQRVSRPGLRRYCPASDVPRVFGGMGITILSTSRGIMTGREAQRVGVGGEILCSVW
ncbi:MAG: 30S ribosomal protein S8 [Gemmatimonadota bacterium]|jgi:small subunit ribosomal protein S8|nr:30S ribosomal protein S8 [Gemmatimonadota bacterium]MDP6460443.1 30S ribosomal protein S8 [Gemmatimonadota bacterium]MDP6530048.1 30S ribosomal protein S8 [Gemmatimonadota bacterium]MDP6803405.1 30S ribosomal protein S8 [Gemmatimonadota bacterium]MDP7032386.1 30S ribosomal protein S8 [Gemmatimonadota bacterium]